MGLSKVMFTSNSMDWCTPCEIVDRVLAVFGTIDLDPCSNSRDEPNVPARELYTKQDDGLARAWFGKVYMNPPYGDLVHAWVKRLVTAYVTGEIEAGIALLPARTDTAWFQPLFDYTLCFWRGRLRFVGAESSAPFPSVIAYLGREPDRFVLTFADAGRVVRSVDAAGPRPLQLTIFAGDNHRR